MKRMAWMPMILALVPWTSAAQMGPMHGHGMGMMQGGGMGMMTGGSPVRRAYVARFGLDPKYAGETNPLSPTRDNIAGGKRLYEQNCAACHGASGLGDGPAAKTLDPPPARIAGLGRMPMMGDGYLHWTIAEGGAPVKSAMPPFKAALAEDDIWKIILFLREL